MSEYHSALAYYSTFDGIRYVFADIRNGTKNAHHDGTETSRCYSTPRFCTDKPFSRFLTLENMHRLPMKSQNACYQVLRKQAKELAKVAKACEKRALFLAREVIVNRAFKPHESKAKMS